MIRVLLADDQALVRAGFRALLEVQDGIEVAGEATDGAEAYRLAGEVAPDVILMDIRMPGTDGLEATRLITADEALSGVRILILTTFELDEYVFEAIRAGASGFLLKDTEPADLLRGLRAVAAGEALLAPSVTRRLIEEFAVRSKRTGPNPAAEQIKALTEREREVLALVAAGLSNEEIADRLVLSPLTAKTHVSRSMVKLGARDRAQLVVLAYESGLVRSGHSRITGPTCSLGPTATAHRHPRTSTFPSRPTKSQVSDLLRFTDRTTRSHALDKAPKALPRSRSLAQ